MRASLKINQIESKISELQSQKQRLLEERQKEIALLIATFDLASLEDNVLIGGLKYLRHKITIQDPIMEDWRTAGERFLRHTNKFKRLNVAKKDLPSLQNHQSS